MLTPIPNSLGAGIPGRDFFPHGAVTSTLGGGILVRIEICIDGQIEPMLAVEGRVEAALVMNAGILDTLPLVGETVTFKNVTGNVVTTLTLTGIIEEC